MDSHSFTQHIFTECLQCMGPSATTQTNLLILKLITCERVGGGGEGTRKQVKVQCIKFGNKCHEGKKKNLGKREKEWLNNNSSRMSMLLEAKKLSIPNILNWYNILFKILCQFWLCNRFVVSQVINGSNYTTDWMQNPQEVVSIHLFLLYLLIISKQKLSAWNFSDKCYTI